MSASEDVKDSTLPPTTTQDTPNPYHPKFDDEQDDDMLNKELCQDLERVFKPLGVTAFTRCCGTCKYNYESDEDFEGREDGGVYFIRLDLGGGGYDPKPENCYAHYEDFDYIMNNWDNELKLLTLFCRVVYRDEMNKQNFRFKIEKPASQNEAICISFIDPVELDPMPKREEDDSW